MGLSSFASLESDSVDFCNHVLIYREKHTPLRKDLLQN